MHIRILHRSPRPSLPGCPDHAEVMLGYMTRSGELLVNPLLVRLHSLPGQLTMPRQDSK